VSPPHTPLRELTAFPQILWLDFMGPTSREMKRGRGKGENRLDLGPQLQLLDSPLDDGQETV